MSLFRRDELRVGLSPDRLVLARRSRRLRGEVSHSVHSACGNPVRELQMLARDADLSIVLSSHYVRYTVLQWSSTLASEKDWTAYARHVFGSTYGNAASGWQIRLCGTGHQAPRVACAVDGELLDSLLALPRVVSIQPYLMSAFNARRGRLASPSCWFVIQEPSRLTLALIANGSWRFVRTRQVQENWRDSLPEVLDREALAADEPSFDQVMLWTEEEAPAQAGPYRLLDLTPPDRGGAGPRPHAMVLS